MVPVNSSDYESLLWACIMWGLIISSVRGIMSMVVYSPDGKNSD